MTGFLRVCLWVFVLAFLRPPAALAQSAAGSDQAPPPPHLSLVEGQVFLEREGRSEPAAENVPLLDGDRIRTGSGRAEIILGDGSLLHLDHATTADMLAGDLVRLLEGRITLIVLGARDPSRAVRYQVDAPAASVQSNGPGEYHVAAVNADGARTTELAVVRGDATFANEAGSVGVRAGERSSAREGDPPGRPQYFNSARWDEFDRWSAARREAQIGTTSARYLPSDLEPYSGTFDRYGTWRNDASNGYVWFPAVSAEWRPYSVGYWRDYDRWDPFWIAGDPWGWPTHHYGRWGFSAGFGWYWIPGRSWASASVYWAVGADYVSWCPLGWNDYPVFGNWGIGGVYVGLHDGWRGWTVIPRRHYGSAVFASHVAIDGRHLDNRSVSGFATGRRSPAIGHAAPRGQAAATSPTQGAPPSRGGRGAATPGQESRGPQRPATREAPPAETRGQNGRTQWAETRSPLAAAAAASERYGRRMVPGAPAGSAPDVGAAAFAQQTRRQDPANQGRQPNAWTAPGSADRVSGRSLPQMTPRAPTPDVRERAFVRQPAPWPIPDARQPVSAPPRAEPRSSAQSRSWPATPTSAADSRVTSRPPVRAVPDAGSRPQPSRPATAGRGSSPEGRPSAPTSRYNSGSRTQPSPSRGTSSRPPGRGGAPE